jgi:hypothetical protein
MNVRSLTRLRKSQRFIFCHSPASHKLRCKKHAVEHVSLPAGAKGISSQDFAEIGYQTYVAIKDLADLFEESAIQGEISGSSSK